MHELSDDARLSWRRSTKCDSGLCVEVAMPADWRKATYSADTANCVEVGFHASTRCGVADCVEVSGQCDCGSVHVRDSADPDGPRLTFEAGAWGDFLAGCKDGEFG